MSRNVSIDVEVTGFVPAQHRKIVAACCREWSFQADDFIYVKPDPPRENNMTATADGQLCGGETESEFIDRLASAVWSANSAYCEVTVRITSLDNLPYDTRTKDETDYRAWRRQIRRVKRKSR